MEKEPKVKLTKTVVEALPLPSSGQVIIWDKELKKFGVRLTPGCRTYIVQGRVNGKSRRIKIGVHGDGGMTSDKARKEAIDIIAGLNKGVDPVVEKKREQAATTNFVTVLNDYLTHRKTKLKESTQADIKRHIERNFSDWLDLPVVNITRDMVLDKFKAISKRGPATADLSFRYVRALLNFAQDLYRAGGQKIIAENPVDVLGSTKLWNKVKPRQVRIPDDKIGAAWNLMQSLRDDPAQTAISRANADLVTVLLLTGCRWSEIAELTWDRVNLEAGWFHLPDPKNRQPITLPLSTVACKILKDRPRTSQHVFPARNKRDDQGHVKDARGTIAKLSVVVGVDLCAHDLRRSFTNVALKKCKLPLPVVRMLTNHKMTGDVTLEVYAESSDMRFLQPETERISRYIVEQGKIAAAGNVISLDARRA